MKCLAPLTVSRCAWGEVAGEPLAIGERLEAIRGAPDHASGTWSCASNGAKSSVSVVRNERICRTNAAAPSEWSQPGASTDSLARAPSSWPWRMKSASTLRNTGGGVRATAGPSAHDPDARDRPRVVGDRVGEHESVAQRWLLDGGDLHDTSPEVVSDEGRAGDAELLEPSRQVADLCLD